jgi:formylglycine-generating enzyme required for sulfatase activity
MNRKPNPGMNVCDQTTSRASKERTNHMMNILNVSTGQMHMTKTKGLVLGHDKVMNTLFSKHARSFSILFLSVLAAVLRVSAQTPAEVDLHLYAGLSITGAVGTVCSIEYVTDLGQTNATDWRCLAYLQLPATRYLWFDPTTPLTGKRFYRAIEFAPTNLVFIPPGTFRMGCPTNEEDSSILDPAIGEYPQMAVTITRGFWMGKYEVTQGEYQAVMGVNPSYFPGPPNRPVEQVTWFDAMNYCAKLTQRERTAGRIATNSVYRLPTEAEWEYACRAWTSTRFSYGDDLGYTSLSDYAWYGVTNGATHLVGQKLPNPWGLYDMHGNVLEWCQDWYQKYPGGIAVDPQGPPTGSSRVFRGGDWHHDDAGCRSGFRFGLPPDSSYWTIGFRVVLVASGS